MVYIEFIKIIVYEYIDKALENKGVFAIHAGFIVLLFEISSF